MLKRTVLSALLIGTLSLGLAACEEKDDQKAGAAKQKEVMARAINAVPAYVPSEYTAREDINWSLQETEGRHVWYVYALSMDGLPLFYVVSDVLPRAKCVSITPPDRKVKGSSGNVVMSSPALDGTYYGGGGKLRCLLPPRRADRRLHPAHQPVDDDHRGEGAAEHRDRPAAA